MYKFNCPGSFPNLILTEWKAVENYNLYDVRKCRMTLLNNIIIYKLENDLYGCYLIKQDITINTVADMDILTKKGLYFDIICMKVPCHLPGNKFNVIDPVYNALLFDKWMKKYNILFRKVYCGVYGEKIDIYNLNNYKLSNQIKQQLINLSGRMILSKKIKILSNIDHGEKIYVIVDGKKIKYLYKI